MLIRYLHPVTVVMHNPSPPYHTSSMTATLNPRKAGSRSSSTPSRVGGGGRAPLARVQVGAQLPQRLLLEHVQPGRRGAGIRAGAAGAAVVRREESQRTEVGILRSGDPEPEEALLQRLEPAHLVQHEPDTVRGGCVCGNGNYSYVSRKPEGLIKL